MNYEEQYLNIMEDILNNGEYTEDRTGVGCYSQIGKSFTIDLQEGFPLLTTKKIFYKNIFGELLWFLSGQTNLPALRKYQNKPEGSHTIWSDDFNKYWDNLDKLAIRVGQRVCESGGNIYSQQWRNFYSRDKYGETHFHDQIEELLDNIEAVKSDPNHPMARRLIVTAWSPYDHTQGDKVVSALSACHTDFQCIVRNGKLHIRYSCRSNDWFLGQPYNTASYALLCHILAELTGLEVGTLTYFGTDVHLYSNHLEQTRTQLERIPSKLPKLVLPKFETLQDVLNLTGEDFIIEYYDPQGFIKAPQAS